jgi:hypothetical protein
VLRLVESDSTPPEARKAALASVSALSASWKDWPGAAHATRAASRLCVASINALQREKSSAPEKSTAADCLRLLCLLVTERETCVAAISELARDSGGGQRVLAAAAAACEASDVVLKKLGKCLAERCFAHAAAAERGEARELQAAAKKWAEGGEGAT